MRGILSVAHPGNTVHRFIPADAGNTRSGHGRSIPPAVHPRGCGEYSTCSAFAAASSGSSPRMRGILSPLVNKLFPRRFIPADAGNTSGRPSWAQSNTVHPRGCGEYVCRTISGRFAPGSSPRMRGIQPASTNRAIANRFIPADAGNTFSFSQQTLPKTVHPRGCGEYALLHGYRGQHRGSSPRMRGIPSTSVTRCRMSRFIPADAGNTYADQSPSGSAPVHPRGCGEYHCTAICAPLLPGSSPRMRGIH